MTDERVNVTEKELLDHLEWGWTIIANSYHGDWDSLAPTDWREAAIKWRDKWYKIVSQTPTTSTERVECPTNHTELARMAAGPVPLETWVTYKFCPDCGQSLKGAGDD